jgi:hypothetical protein
METIKGFFDSFKEFIWDIIGYLLPGSYVLIILSVFVHEEYFVIPSLGTSTNDFYPFIIIVTSYLIGHVTYGVGWFKDELFKRVKFLTMFSYVKTIEANIAKRKAFTLTRELISRAFEEKGINDDFKDISVRDLRNIAMSFIPESDQKIYTFMFRSELSNQIGNISIVIGILGLISSFFEFTPLHIFKTETHYVVVYFCLIISYFFLRQTRNRFYAISLGLPFSLYIAKAIKQ